MRVWAFSNSDKLFRKIGRPGLKYTEDHHHKVRCFHYRQGKMNAKQAKNSNIHGEYQLQETGKQTVAEQNIDKSGSVASFCADETIFLGGESCFLDVDSLVPISALKKGTCRRSKSYPPVVRTAPSFHHERLLPRRPRLNRERQSAWPQNGKSPRYKGRPQRSLGKSLSVEPSKMSVARRRHFEQKVLSTHPVHKLPPLAERRPVASCTGKNSDERHFQKGEGEAVISISDVGQISRRKNIFLPPDLSPLEVPQASLAEQEEFQNWKRKVLEGTVKNCRTVKSINCVKTSSNQSKMAENQSKTSKNNSRIPHEAGVTQQFFSKSKASSDVNTAQEATINTKGFPIAEKSQEITTQSSRPPFPDSSLSPTMDLKEKTRALLLGSMFEVKQERKVIKTYSEEDCTSNTSEFPRRSEIPDIEIADKTVENDSFPWKTENNSKSFHLKYAKKYQNEALDRFHEGKYQPALESQSNVHSEQELNRKSRADLLLVKKLNKRRLLFRLARQGRHVETEPIVDRLSNHFVNTNNATKDDGTRKGIAMTESGIQVNQTTLDLPFDGQKNTISFSQKEKNSCVDVENDNPSDEQVCNVVDGSVVKEGPKKEETVTQKQNSCKETEYGRLGEEHSYVHRLAIKKKEKEKEEKHQDDSCLTYQSLQYKKSHVDLALVETNVEGGSLVCKYEACASSKELEKPNQVNPHSFMTPNRKNGTCSEPAQVNTFQEKGSYHTPSDRSGNTENDIVQFQNYYSVIRGRREGQCIGTVSGEKLRFLRVVRKRF